MFDSISIKSEDHLAELVTEVKKSLKKNIHQIKYPDDVTNSKAKDNWEEVYLVIDEINKQLLSDIEHRGGIYAIFSAKPEKEWDLKYIGQVNSKGARQRIRSHIIWRNKMTLSGRSTGSKLDEVIREISRGKEIALSFVEINPETLRHYVEEVLIDKCQPLWNIHGTTLVGQNSSRSRRCL